MLYCVFGCIWNRVRNPDNKFSQNIPNVEFWCLLPKYTWTGCIITKEKLLSHTSSHNNIDQEL